MYRSLSSLTGHLFLFALLSFCSTEPFSYADSLREQISSLEQAVNRGESALLMEVIAADFFAEYLTDRRQLKLFLLRQRNQYNRVTSTSGPAQVSVQLAETTTTAKASFISSKPVGAGEKMLIKGINGS